MKDFKLKESDKIIEDKEVELIVQQIDLLFDTKPKEVFGEPFFGSDFYQFLHDLQVSNRRIESYITTLITSNVYMFEYSVDCNVDLLRGNPSDIILVTIIIKNNYNQYKKIYKIG